MKKHPVPKHLTSHDMWFDAAYVVESLPAGERRTGVELYDSTIGPASFRHDKLHTQLFTPKNSSEFFGDLKKIARLARTQRRWPLLHFETHGSVDGLELGSGELVGWTELKPYLQDINIATRLNTAVTVAACHGGYLARTIVPHERAPAWTIIGPADRMGGDVLLKGFQTFYGEFLTTLSGNKAMAALRDFESRVGKKFLFLPVVEMFFSAYRDYLQDWDTPAGRSQRERDILALVAEQSNQASADADALAASVREQLEDQETWFEGIRDYFFMYDLWEMNADLFPVMFNDVSDRPAGRT